MLNTSFFLHCESAVDVVAVEAATGDVGDAADESVLDDLRQ